MSVARSGLASRPAAALLCAGAFVAFMPVPGAYVLLLAGIAASARSLAARSSVQRAPLASSAHPVRAVG